MLPKPLILILIAAAAAIFIVVLRLVLRRRKRRKQFEEIAQIKRRDEALNEALRNPQMDLGAARTKGPIEVSWDDKAVRGPASASGGVMVELIELSAYSRRKYIFRADEPITIGSGKDNQLVLCREGVEARHCEIRMNGKKPCVRSLSRAKTVLIRKKTSVLVSTEGVYLNNGDHIQLGESELQFRLFKG